jgi:predicted DCC family thiol-disulfide oxidoreductase YuxK
LDFFRHRWLAWTRSVDQFYQTFAAGSNGAAQKPFLAFRQLTWQHQRKMETGPCLDIMTAPSLVVWYNTRCPVCDAGIDWQRNKLLTAVRAGRLAFRDINDEPTALSAYGASLEDIRRRLHATDDEGRLIVGADVVIAIWRRTAGEGWLARLFGNRLMLPLTRFGYDRFADLLFAWNRWKGHW